jgi:diaminopimelate epimerase
VAIAFSKYQGTGNDFILIDDRQSRFNPDPEVIAAMCNRHFGIGADGLILLRHAASQDFTMRYFNSDGHESTMCGNGGRCLVRFAADVGLVGSATRFEAIDGLHEARILPDGRVALGMQDVAQVEQHPAGLWLHTGSPHLVCKVPQVAAVDVHRQGETLRHDPRYAPGGTNVNFVEVANNLLRVRTFERGVEAETLSCGTGVTAAAIAAWDARWLERTTVPIETPGGLLEVSFDPWEGGYRSVVLTGPAQFVFEGSWAAE